MYFAIVFKNQLVDIDLVECHVVSNVEKISISVKIFDLCAYFHEKAKFSLNSLVKLEDIIDAFHSSDDSRAMESNHLGADISVCCVEFHDFYECREFVNFSVIELYYCLFSLFYFAIC